MKNNSWKNNNKLKESRDEEDFITARDIIARSIFSAIEKYKLDISYEEEELKEIIGDAAEFAKLHLDV